jgi:hypothetical protein
MSELIKLQNKFLEKGAKVTLKLQVGFLTEKGELQEDCKHEKTHWLQEIAVDGSFKAGLFKRCFICGATIDKLKCEPEFVEQLLIQFDISVEAYKAKMSSVQVAEDSCAVCGMKFATGEPHQHRCVSSVQKEGKPT